MLQADTPVIPVVLPKKPVRRKAGKESWPRPTKPVDDAKALLLLQIPNRVTFDTLFDAMLTEKRIEKD
ncbi:hypothetical protein GGE16_004151 [Rhizobium leguminosarum]|uniref:Uncharacterized protein n=1 Tax=Rhizobium leguminosarum TaxID=384 RepID=A0AAE2SY40_RHILE|nr:MULTISPECIES: hypothetical protein [Rhizobium]MBB4292075.1 hypothetical protein [Rhizobium leguminosarum]MBB4299623.1 hypothetical protein [Rhizobium leguminosarum]MBB4309987.1 hypothetical protein [Rhizobium leguminosarum]MBB4419272.1 hypothetical protein [Rhizobium leguminosarum]MBB4434075.1 hypothetical protein [Rhizobium esperanzae]